MEGQESCFKKELLSLLSSLQHACKAVHCGAFSGSQWFQLQWNSALEKSHITLKELIPIVLAAAIWEKQWTGKTVLAQCDNTAVVAIINSGSSKDAEVMHFGEMSGFCGCKV